MNTLQQNLEKIQVCEKLGREKLLSSHGIEFGVIGRQKMAIKPHFCKQVHSCTVVKAGDETAFASPNRVQADGLWTASRGTILAVRTADCLPVLITDMRRQLTMALHAGWRGLTAGIIGQGLQIARQELDPKKLLLFIGPAVGKSVYEVGPEVKEAANGTSLGLSPEQLQLAFASGNGERFYFDIGLAAVFTALNHGVLAENISLLRSCTYSNPDTWHSYRYSGKHEGSNWSWIVA